MSGMSTKLAILVALLAMCHAADRKCRLAQSQTSVDQLGDVIVHLVVTLQWSSVTLLFDDVSGALVDVTDQLHALIIPTMILIKNVSAITIVNHCGKDIQGGYVVVGSFEFIQNVFNQAAECAERTNQGNILFFSEWLTVIEDDDMQPSLRVFHAFENVAVVVIAKKSTLSLWTLHKVKDDSELSLVTSLPHDVISLTRQKVMPNPSYGLGGRTIRVVTKTTANLMMMPAAKGDPFPYKGFVMEILHELSVRLNFSYLFVPAADDSWGIELDNGQWDGPIGMLMRKEVDLAASAFAIEEGRASVVDATTPFLSTTAVVIFRKALTKQYYWTFFLQPFHSVVYKVVAGSLVFVLLLLSLLEKGEQGLTDGKKNAIKVDRVTWRRIMANLQFLFGALLSRPSTWETTSRAGRMLAMTWLLLGVVLASLYSSELTSSLTVHQDALPFTSLEEMLNQEEYTWGFENGTSIASILKASTNRQLQQLYQGTLRFAETDPSVLSRDVDVHLDKVGKGKYAFFSGNSIRYDVLSARYCDIAMLPDLNIAQYYGFYLQNGSAYTRLVSDEISKMLDSGLLDVWRQKWSPKKKQCDEKDDRAIDIHHTQTAFYLAAAGLVLATLALGIERFVMTCLSRRTKDEVVNSDMVNSDMVNSDMVNSEMVNSDMVNSDMVNSDMVTDEEDKSD
ncbi:probable glutamate receptor [Littorina saxatilis]|uniref:probable glutamate receptor n=1 Tax=Littorina saxatilis TaxID=31220 RepID=UPI0038B660A1